MSAEFSLDAAVLDSLAESLGSENLVGILELVLKSAPEAGAELRDGAAAGDLDRVARAAHKLKSECAYMGANDLVSRLQDIESQAGAGTLPDPVQQIASIGPHLDDFLEQVRRERETRARATP